MSRILILDDEINLQKSLALFWAEKGFEVRTASSAAEGLDIVGDFLPQVVILDVRLPDASGLDILEPITKQSPASKVIVITAYHDMETTIKAMRRGAFDYIHKPIDIDELEQSVARATHQPLIAGQLSDGPRSGEGGPDQPRLVGNSKAMRQTYKAIGKLTTNLTTVLIQGETGTGKEVTARVIHERSPLAGHPFVTIDCTTLVDSLMESELFGHEHGAFTGAVSTKKGRLEMASSGTVFFDEIGELSPSVQAKLLGFLERREFCRVGGVQTLRSGARIIGATNQSLDDMVKEGRFRRDLMFRLKVATIELPPLRERIEDLDQLVPYFLRRINRELGTSMEYVEKGAGALLRAYTWPGNVRELLNVLTKAVIDCQGEVLLAGAIKAALAHSSNKQVQSAAFPTLAEAEEAHIQRALKVTDWNISATARLLGVTRPTLRGRMAKHGLNRPEGRQSGKN
jgi:two-component system response regulator AtoC